MRLLVWVCLLGLYLCATTSGGTDPSAGSDEAVSRGLADLLALAPGEFIVIERSPAEAPAKARPSDAVHESGQAQARPFPTIQRRDAHAPALVSRIEARPSGRSWIGRWADQPGSRFVLTYEDGAYSGGGWCFEGAFELHPTGKQDAQQRPVFRAEPLRTDQVRCLGASACTVCPEGGAHAAPPAQAEVAGWLRDPAGHSPVQRGGGEAPARQAPSARGRSANHPGHGCDCADDAARVDVLVVYSGLARAAAGGAAALHARIQNAFDATNVALLNSAVGPLRVEPVALVEVAYDEAAPEFLDHLRRITDPADGVLDEVHPLRNAHKADCVALIVNDPRFTGGSGWFSVYDDSSAFTCTNWRALGGGDLTFAHELGHNFGCDHNREAAGFPPFHYAYGHYFTAASVTYGTIMSYIGQTIPYYSNPNLTHPSGALLGAPLSTPAPSANALVISRTRWSLANFRVSGRIRDCNGNGVADELDIASGFSRDDNQNCLPDECEQRLYVDAAAAVDGDGLSWAAACRDLSVALEVAHIPCSNVSEIWVAEGVYRPGRGTGDRYARFMLRDGLAIYGGFQGQSHPAGGETERAQRDSAAHLTILSGDLGVAGDPSDNSFTVVGAEDVGPTAILDGFTIAAGHSPWSAGGLYGVNAGPTIRDCVFRDHLAWDSAAVHLREGGTARFERCAFLNNTSSGGAGAVVLDIGTAAAFSDCRFEQNTSAWAGGGLAVYGAARADLDNCRFEANSALYGGAVAFGPDTEGVVRSSVFERNTAVHNGGALDVYAAAPRFRDCRIEANCAEWGGGVHTGAGAAPVFVACSFDANEAFAAGGALRGADAAAVLVNCRLAGNHTHGSGGALDGWSSTWRLYNTLLLDNTADNDGGGLSDSGGTIAELVNCTLAGNTAQTGVGGGVVLFGGTLTLSNSILWANHSAADLDPQDRQLRPFGASVSVAHSCIQGWNGLLGGVGNIGADPGFVDRPAGDLRLQAGSPAIDAGRNAALPLDEYDLDEDGVTTVPLPLDLAGLPRFRDEPAAADCPHAPGTCGSPPLVDMGAYEYAGVAARPGDMNCDGAVNFDDISGFVTALVGRAAYEAAYPDCRWLNGDVDGSGVVDFNDINAFVGCLIAGGC